MHPSKASKGRQRIVAEFMHKTRIVLPIRVLESVPHAGQPEMLKRHSYHVLQKISVSPPKAQAVQDEPFAPAAQGTTMPLLLS